jgi:hypothetical protein
MNGSKILRTTRISIRRNVWLWIHSIQMPYVVEKTLRIMTWGDLSSILLWELSLNRLSERLQPNTRTCGNILGRRFDIWPWFVLKWIALCTIVDVDYLMSAEGVSHGSTSNTCTVASKFKWRPFRWACSGPRRSNHFERDDETVQATLNATFMTRMWTSRTSHVGEGPCQKDSELVMGSCGAQDVQLAEGWQ